MYKFCRSIWTQHNRPYTAILRGDRAGPCSKTGQSALDVFVNKVALGHVYLRVLKCSRWHYHFTSTTYLFITNHPLS